MAWTYLHLRACRRPTWRCCPFTRAPGRLPGTGAPGVLAVSAALAGLVLAVASAFSA